MVAQLQGGPEHQAAVDSWSSPKPGVGLVSVKGRLVPSVRNVLRAVGTPGWWRAIAWDAFADALVWAPWGSSEWRQWVDEDYTECQVQLEADGLRDVPIEMLRRVVGLVGQRRRVDTGIRWARSLKWDGTARVDRFHEWYCGAEPGEYATAVSRYLWSALAARLLHPGAKVDMVVIWVGAGGARKSTMAAALAPYKEAACRINLKHPDEEIARMLKGTVVAEVAELRGLFGRDSESIKDFFSATSDKWRPVYKEFTTTHERRCVFVGTTDKDDFLADAAGNLRRWLAIRVDEMEVEALEQDRDQLWAESIERFGGRVQWEAAEKLGALHHQEFTLDDSWGESLVAWADSVAPSDIADGVLRWGDCGFTVRDALVFGLGMAPSSINRGHENRAGAALKAAGFISGRGLRSNGTKDRRVWRLK